MSIYMQYVYLLRIDLCCKTTAEYRAYYSDLEKHENETEK